MTRNFAWRFLQIGRRIERARQLAELTRELVLDRPSPRATAACACCWSSATAS